jgi:hypothetical protein
MRPELHLLRKIGMLPDGAKVPVASLARELGITQLATLSMLEALVACGSLDRETLRPTALRPRLVPVAELVCVGEILPEIEQFLAATGMAPSRFGKEVLNDYPLVAQMRLTRRKRITKASADAIRSYIARNTRGASGDEGGRVDTSTGVGSANGPSLERERRTPDTAASTAELGFSDEFLEQLQRVERGEVGIAPVIRVPRAADPDQTLGGVATGQL